MQCVQLWLEKGARHLSTLTSQVSPASFSPPRSMKSNPPDCSRTMNELAEVAEKIIQNVNAVFEKDNLLDEFDIVPQESQANRSPVLHHQRKLGLESWCTGFVYSHSFRNFITLRPQKSVQNNRSELLEQNPSDSSIKNNNVEYSQLTEVEKWRKCLELTRLLVLLNPDLTSAWNFRREAFKNGYSTMEEEFQLVALVASRKPKCPEGFGYRKWLIKEATKTGMLDMAHSLTFFQREAKVALLAASKYFSNYHAWDYRLFLMEAWISNNDVPGDVKESILNSEKEVSDTWLNTHISDYCGYHFRQKLLDYVLQFQLTSAEESKALLLTELKENRGIILFYPGHESLWYHRRMLLKKYIVLFSKSELEDELDSLRETERSLVEVVTPNARGTTEENSDTHNNLKEHFHISDCIQLNLTYSGRHLRWINVCLI